MIDASERQRRWRLVLGSGPADGIGISLGVEDAAADAALAALYDSPRKGGLGPSCPSIPRWLGDIRKYFPKSVVQVMQRDALERLELHSMLTEPETLEAIQPDVHLVSTLLSLRGVLPARTKETARIVVRKVVDDLLARLSQPMRQAINGALNRAARNRRPRHNEIDWHRTIRANLKHFQPDYGTIIPETRVGFGRKRTSMRDVILCIDQSGSMAASVVYASVFGAVMASLPAVRTKLVVFDTSVVDLTDELDDPVELLFSTQLGGGTDINRAVRYCEGIIGNPSDTILVLISDLFEGGVEAELLKRAASLVSSGVQFIALLALSDEGAPAFDQGIAASLSALGVPSFACSPDNFADLMAAAIERRDLNQWAAERGIVASRKKP
ncbi:MAG: VWA domain-containing protein [Phycisphaerae bacterium]|nr:VWA domain-containing protein [Phycisphaerae bacterium]